MRRKKPCAMWQKAGDGSMRDALSLLDQCIAFYLGQTLTYDKVLDVLGAVDTEVFSQLLRKSPEGRCDGSNPYFGGADCGRKGAGSVRRRFYLVYAKSPSCQDFRKSGRGNRCIFRKSKAAKKKKAKWRILKH